jgi:hypothetical protein
MVEQIEFEVDKVATITRKIAEMTEDGNKEKEAVETAFKKFDTDGSGDKSGSGITSLGRILTCCVHSVRQQASWT